MESKGSALALWEFRNKASESELRALGDGGVMVKNFFASGMIDNIILSYALSAKTPVIKMILFLGKYRFLVDQNELLCPKLYSQGLGITSCFLGS